MNGVFYANGIVDINTPTSYLQINGAVHANSLIVQGTRGVAHEASDTLSLKCSPLATYLEGSVQLQYAHKPMPLNAPDPKGYCFSTEEAQKLTTYAYKYRIDRADITGAGDRNYEERVFHVPVTDRLIINYDPQYAVPVNNANTIVKKLDPPTRISK